MRCFCSIRLKRGIPVCLGCGAMMVVASHEARETKHDFIPSDVLTADAQKGFSASKVSPSQAKLHLLRGTCANADVLSYLCR
jgi:hypothetical protein